MIIANFRYSRKKEGVKIPIRVKNTEITDTRLNEKLEKRIRQELKKITPYFDEVQEIAIS